MTIVRIVKNWDFPDILRQTPRGNGIWEGIQFVCGPIEECDYLVFLNNLMQREVQAYCPAQNIWAVMQEPYYRGHSDWLIEGHDFFAKVFTHHPPSQGKKYITSHPALPWHVDKNYDQLIDMEPPRKTKKISGIIGNANDLPGHARRFKLLKVIQADKNLDIDLFGRAVRPIDDKWDGLAPYEFSLAIENSSSFDYWTEKIADCFLAWTVPLYYGCKNIDKYFPSDSFIKIDINDPGSCIGVIKLEIEKKSWKRRLSALEEARDLVLNRYQLFPFIAEQIRASSSTKDRIKKHITIPPYKRSLRASLNRFIYKLRKTRNF
ncbi:MAG TPA: hypothetical protein ENN23_08785 [Deltaproteobacteria bacterium]|nr:hypothetical protein [Deltaproteobacteria bacterium]